MSKGQNFLRLHQLQTQLEELSANQAKLQAQVEHWRMEAQRVEDLKSSRISNRHDSSMRDSEVASEGQNSDLRSERDILMEKFRKSESEKEMFAAKVNWRPTPDLTTSVHEGIALITVGALVRRRRTSGNCVRRLSICSRS